MQMFTKYINSKERPLLGPSSTVFEYNPQLQQGGKEGKSLARRKEQIDIQRTIFVHRISPPIKWNTSAAEELGIAQGQLRKSRPTKSAQLTCKVKKITSADKTVPVLKKQQHEYRVSSPNLSKNAPLSIAALVT